MPEHDTFDLDAVFRAFEHDVAELSRPLGAGAAVASARRRRRTTWTGVAAGLALVLGAAAVAQGVTARNDADGPASPPTPAAFDAAAFNRAAAGWMPGWNAVPNPDVKQMGTFAQRCVEALGADAGSAAAPDAARATGVVLSNPQTFSIAVGTLAQWSPEDGSTADAAFAGIRTGIQKCPTAIERDTYTWAGARGQSWEVGTPKNMQHLWLAEADHGVAVLWTTGGTTNPVPDEVDRRVMTALVAGIGAPGSYLPVSTSVTTQTTAPQVISPASFTKALRGWPTGWQRHGTAAGNSIPCARGWLRASTASTTGGLGGNGEQAYGTYPDAQDAEAALERVRASLRSCPGATYDVPAPVQGGGVTVLVASGPRIVWAVASQDQVGVVSIPAGEVAVPPQRVTTAVVGRLLAAMPGGRR